MPTPLTLDAWQRAVVHLECAADSTNARTASFEELQTRPTKDVRWTGTALFVEDEDERAYLVTARHVLRLDEMARLHSFRWFDPGPPDGQDVPLDWWDEQQRLLDIEREQQWIAPMIFRVPRYPADTDNPDEPTTGSHMLGWLSVGSSMGHAYTYSAPELDLAVISLSQSRNDSILSEFLDGLRADGYEPISTSQIAAGPSSVGADVSTVGFPGTATVARREMHPANQHWSSSSISLPVASWGRVAMDHEQLPYFWADMTVYPGNSGGPVVENGQLVGVVSSQAVVEGTRVPFAQVMKAGAVRGLLERQRAKDRWRGAIDLA